MKNSEYRALHGKYWADKNKGQDHKTEADLKRDAESEARYQAKKKALMEGTE